MSALKGTLVAVGALLSFGGVARADEVTHWNLVMLDAFRTDFGTGCPCPLARSGAIVHCAIYDAINSIDRTHTAYMGFVEAPPGASREAAVASAAYHTMLELFPNMTAELDAAYAERLALIPDSQAKDDGIATGVAAASRMMLERADDGSQKKVPYDFGMNPGDYIPTPPGFNPICNPEWVTVTPFCMQVGTQYRSAGPAGFTNMAELLASPEYAFQVNMVKELGARNSKTRTDEQARIAFFWANDVNGTAKPPGHLFDITRVVSEDHGLTLAENARLFALVAMAMGDAGIVSWDMKYGTDIDLWRPISAIHHADLDGNDATEADRAWESLNPFSPPFPAYVSGHATFAGAHAGTMASFFGRDDITFTVDSEDPFYNALPEHGPRTFHSFSEAAVENGLSRIYLGVHFLFDAVDGNAAGFSLGHDVVAQFLTPVCRADFNSDRSVSSEDFFGFLDAFFADNWRAEINGDGTLNSQDFFDYLTEFFAGC